MSTLKVNTIEDANGSGPPNFPFGFSSGGIVPGKSMSVLATAQGFIPNGVYTKISLDTVVQGTDDGTFNFDSANNWFIPKAGWYQVNAYIKLEGNNGSILVSSAGNLGLFKNSVTSTPDFGLGGSGTTGTATNIYTAVLSWAFFMNGTDKLILAATETDSANSQAATDSVAMSITAIGNV